jgi:hypothetical protein
MPYQQLLETRLKFLDIDEKTIDEIRKAKKILEPAMDEALDELYSRILKEPELKSIFKDKSVIKHARSAQKKHWMDSLFKGQFDSAYYEATYNIGLTHARISLTPNWYIGAYNQMLCKFIALIYQHHADNPELAISMVQSVSKIVFLDIDLVIRCYMEAKDEAIRRMLVSSTELRADMWKFSDELNDVASEINLATRALAEKTEEEMGGAAKETSSTAKSWKGIFESAKVLQSQAERLSSQTSGLEQYLESLPLSEKLYLPKAGFLTELKDAIFRKKYHNPNPHQ